MRTTKRLTIAITLLAAGTIAAAAQDSELEQLKNTMKAMEQQMEQMKQKIADLERAKPVAPTPAGTNTLEASSKSIQTLEKVAAGEQVSQKSPVTYRETLNDQQEAASRPKDYTLDPTYRGFVPVPNTPALIKFNAKPHVDFTWDNKNAGNQNRFVPAVFPLHGEPTYGGGEQFHANANATQLKLDVRAPEMPGDFRFYYQNDFFGSGSDTGDMKYRVQHLYGQLYGFKAGFTYGVWEDPDSWPDTVDYEGPNAVIFSRRPVAQYTHSWNENWNSTVGVEKPDIFVDLNSGPNPGTTQLTAMPDLGFNTRYEKEGLGHFQFSTIFRDLGAKDALGESHHVFGWGVNLSANIDITKKDYLQFLGVYGEGVGGMGNDTSFLNSDAAFGTDGSLHALPYWSASTGFTHRWNSQFRSTITYGYVDLSNTFGQDPTFYHTSHYASANLIWQLRKRLSVGLEGLYGFKEARNGIDSGDHWRVQLGMVYSLFD
ncbi:MAG TPA: DcaP family trimeric outer membrane transporter [Candidatus Limnocylindrales bacterium]|nr:DcaP family trimeric outer membrane transporter [Candidatus Limnocylindrales bacterium]